ncbi:MAG: hypothetical protein M1535_00595 [Candidatus Thermoplasmatota archaeon]|jgi:hypothetical protein|nr:hypothetical protein [Candidatus Thermoplasmatota archaeon]
MKRKIKIIIIGIIMFSILSTISYSMEPHGWTPDEGMYGFAEKHYSNINGFCVFFNKYNYTESQGDFSVGMYAQLIGNRTHTQLQCDNMEFIIPFGFSVYILGENLSFPFNTMSLEIGKTTLSSSGPILTNVSAYNDSNILTAFTPSADYFATPLNSKGYANPNLVQGAIGTYQVNYFILTYYNYTTQTQHYMKAGNYSMNFTFRFTPVFELGPYYETGNQLSISITWRWTILPTPPYVPP